MFSKTLRAQKWHKSRLLKPGYVCHSVENEWEAGVSSQQPIPASFPPFYGENGEIKI